MDTDQQKIRKVKKKYEKQWLSVEGVVGVGIGTLSNDEIGIVISVVKLDDQILKKLPAQIEGVGIEVKESGEFKAL